jgi:hypothetical protein
MDEIHPEPYQIIEFRPLSVAHSPSCFRYWLFSSNIVIRLLCCRNREGAASSRDRTFAGFRFWSRPEAALTQTHVCYNRRRAKDQEQKQACRPVS